MAVGQETVIRRLDGRDQLIDLDFFFETIDQHISLIMVSLNLELGESRIKLVFTY